MSEIKSIAQIQEEIRTLSPHPEKVKLLAVSKKQPVSKIQDVINQKQFIFGENYVQEALEKIETLPKNIEWHLIGHLQSKKVNSVIGKFACIHSIDSIKLAKIIGQKSNAAGVNQDIFVEINLSNEQTKTGFSVEEIKSKWLEITAIDSVRILGLMTLPPPKDSEIEIREYFKNLKQLLRELKNKTDTSKHPMDGLSIGTSQDYKIALQEGSTLIRVGTILFGERV